MTERLKERIRGGLHHRLARIGGVMVGTLTRVRTREPVAALTFDDGPHPDFTPRLLDLLAAHGARATFFMTGENAAAHPEVVARAHEEGHAVANHTWSHATFPPLTHGRRREELRRCREALGPRSARLFRPPKGLQSRRSYLSTRLSGYDVVGWSVEAKDWTDRSEHELAGDLRVGIRPGSIVLLHDRIVDPSSPAVADRSALLVAVDRTLGSLSHLRFVTVPELVATGQPVRVPWFIRTDDDWN